MSGHVGREVLEEYERTHPPRPAEPEPKPSPGPARFLALQRQIGNQAMGRMLARLTYKGNSYAIDLSKDKESKEAYAALRDSPDVHFTHKEVRDLETAHGALGPAPPAPAKAVDAGKGHSAAAAKPLWALLLTNRGLSDVKADAWGKALSHLDDAGMTRVGELLQDAALAAAELEKYVDTLLKTGLTGADLVRLNWELTHTGLKGAELAGTAATLVAAGIPSAKLAAVVAAQLEAGVAAQDLAKDVESLKGKLTGTQAGGGLASGLTATEIAAIKAAGVTAQKLGEMSEEVGGALHGAMEDGGWTAAGVKEVLDFGAGVPNVPLARAIRLGQDLTGAYYSANRTAWFLYCAKRRCGTSLSAWAQALGLVVDFIQAPHAQGAGTHGRRGAVVGNLGSYTVGGGAYEVDVVMGANARAHVKEGHTFEGFWFELGNCHRADAQGGSSMFAPGTNVLTEAAAAAAPYSVFMDNAAWNRAPDRDTGQALYEVAFGGGQPPLRRPGQPDSYRIWVEMLFPKGAKIYAKVHGDIMEGIGRLFGHIT
jgi:hypothetical protein